ncbi:hypothetical protein GTP44_22140 [Duganella sp. FT50W]|uniref:Uncharacterized protein n=1 Tax=Duganella lactea TaxID=2692173 RepID=A0A6L8MRH1_9BURK|nr:hypothetical protein [Duganella lactea]MYM84637.1 hypothetical protein [Duganella lactea]
MQATIYVTKEAMATAIAIKDLDYYTRVSLSDNESTDVSTQPGYYLKSAGTIKLDVLPTTAHVAAHISSCGQSPSGEISMPANLRGCIFERAPDLPDRYAEIIAYWSGQPLSASDYRAVYFQNPQNEYLVELRGNDDNGAYVSIDKLLSEGIVVSITGMASITDGLSPEDFIEFEIPIDVSMVGIESDGFLSPAPYKTKGIGQREVIYLKVSDITRSPNPDHILIDLLRYELLDYGYWY